MLNSNDEPVYKFSEWQNKQVRTYVINPRNKTGPLKTLSDGIRIAKPYERVEVVGGDYIETVSIDKPIEIVASEGEVPLVTFRGTAFNFSTNCASYIEGISISCKSKAKDNYAVVISCGSPVFSKCTITNMKVCGLGKPVVTNCDIEQSLSGGGLYITDQAGGDFSDNNIRNHGEFCVAIDSSYPDLKLKRNTIYQPSELKCLGVVKVSAHIAGELCRPLFEGNRIWDKENPSVSETPLYVQKSQQPQNNPALSLLSPTNPRGPHSDGYETRRQRAVVLIEGACRPTFLNNDIHNGDVGIRCSNDSCAQIIQNRILRNSFAGVHIYADNGTLIEKNRISDNLQNGLLIEQGRGSRIVRNDIQGNVGGLWVDDTSDTSRGTDNPVHIQQNNIINCCNFGVVFTGHASAVVLAENFFGKNEGISVIVRDHANPLVKKNVIKDGHTHGVAIGNHGRGIVEENEILENGGSGVYVEAFGIPTAIRGNTIQANRQNGITITGLGATCSEVRKNTLTMNSLSQICVSDLADPMVTENVVVDGRLEGIEVKLGGRGTFVGNTVSQNRGDGIRVSDNSDPLFELNEVSENIGAGLQCCDGALGSFIKNKFLRNIQSNVTIGSGADITLRSNIIANGNRYGLHVVKGGLSIIEKNTFEENLSGNICIEGPEAAPFITRNRVLNSKGVGIQSTGGGGRVMHNWVSGNTQGGLVSSACGSTFFSNNTVINENGCGIRVFDGGSSTFDTNHVLNSRESGIWIEGSHSAPTVVRNTFEKNSRHGMVFACVDNKKSELRQGVVKNNTVLSNDGCGIVCMGNIGLMVSVNEICGNGIDGVSLEGCRRHSTNSSTLRLEENMIHKNARYGIRVVHSGGTQVHVEGNQIFEHSTNIYVENNRDVPESEYSPPTFHRNQIRNAKEINIEVTNYGTSIFKANHIFEAPVGVLISSYGRGDFQSNTLDNLSVAAFRVMGHSAIPLVNENKIVASPIAIEITSNAEGTYSKNTITCDLGIIVASHAKPLVKGNKITKCKTHGIHIKFQSGGTVTENSVTDCVEGGILVDNENCGMQIEKNIISGNANYGIRIDVSGETVPSKKNTVIEGNSVSNNMHHGILIGQGATPRTLRNTITANTLCGIIVEKGGQGYIGYNTIEKNSSHGVLIQEDAIPEVEHNTIHNGLMTGLYCEPKAGGNVLYNSFAHNNQYGIVMEGGTKLSFKHNSVGPNGLCGLKVFSDSTALFATPEIAENKFYSVSESKAHCFEISGVGSNPTVVNNIFEKGSIGLIIQEGGKGTLRDNLFTNFSKHAMLLMDEDSAPVITKNTFRTNAVGITVTSSVCCSDPNTVFENNFDDNLCAGVSISCGSSIVVSKNTFTGHQNACILVSGRGTTGTIKGNQFRSAANVVGVEITNHANPTVTNNFFVQCARAGVSVVNNGMGIVDHNWFCSNSTAGIYLSTLCRPTVTRNVFCHHVECAVFIDSGADGILEKNDILHNTLGCKVTACGHVAVRNNTIHDNEKYGISMFQGGDAQIESNYFHTNGEGDVLMTDGANGCIATNMFLGRIVCTTGSTVKVQRNYFMSMKHLRSETDSADDKPQGLQGTGTGIVISDKGNPRIVSNVLCGLGLAASIYQEGRGTFDSNSIIYCGKGIEVSEGGDPSFVSNDIKHCIEFGISVRDGGLGYYQNNTVAHINKACVTIQQNANPNMEGNKISHGVHDGILCTGSGSAGIIQGNTVSSCKNNVRIINEANPSVKENNIFDGGVGILITQGGHGSLTSNNIFDNDVVGLVVEQNVRDCVITSNRISSSQDNGAVEIDKSAEVTMKQNIIRNQFSPVFNKSLGTSRMKVRRNTSEEDRISQEKLDVKLFETKRAFLDLQAGMVIVHEGLMSKGGFEDHIKLMIKPMAISRNFLRKSSMASMRNDVQTTVRAKVDSGKRRVVELLESEVSKDSIHRTPSSEKHRRSRTNSLDKTKTPKRAKDGDRRRSVPDLSSPVVLPLVLPALTTLTQSPMKALSPMKKRKVCFSHIPPSFSCTFNVDEIQCDCIELPSHLDGLRRAISEVDVLITFITVALAHTVEFHDEFRILEGAEAGKVLFVNVDPEYCVGGMLVEPVVREAVRKHRLYTFRSNDELSEIISLGIMKHIASPRIIFERIPPLTYVSCCLQSVATMQSILAKIVTSRPDLNMSFSMWTESKTGKQYNRWVRAGYQGAAHLVVLVDEQYLVQNRCMKEYTSFQHLPTTGICLDAAATSEKGPVHPLTTFVWDIEDPNTVVNKIADHIWSNFFYVKK